MILYSELKRDFVTSTHTRKTNRVDGKFAIQKSNR